MNPRTYQWNANIERQLPGQFLLTVAYVGTRGTHLFNNRELNPGIFDPNTGTTTRLNPDRGSIFVRSNHGDSVYHGLQVDAARRFSHGLLLRGAWTYSRSIDNTSEIFVTSGGSTRFQDQLDPSGRADRGPSAFDRKHRAVFTWVYDLPKPPSGEGFTKVLSLIARDWQISGTAAFETGAPETIHTGGFDINGDLSGFNDRPFFGSASVPINFANCFQPTATCDSGVGFSLDGVTFTDFNSSFGFDPVTGNFTAKASDFRYYFILGKNGNVGRNSFYNPGRQDWTMAVSKRIKMPMAHLEGQQIELRMEAFNPWNHANLGGGANGVASVSGDINSPNFLDTSVTKWGGRSVRFWVKYNF
jgi:hypothetical protein